MAENFPAAAPKAPDEKANAKSGEMVPVINFDNMPLGQVLDFYSELVNRTVLRGASLPITTFLSMKAGPITKAEAVAALDATMALNGFKTLPASEKFVVVTTQWQFDSVVPIADKLSKALEKAPVANVPADGEKKVPLINFNNMRMAQVCAFYADLAGRELNKDEIAPYTFVSLRTREPITETEALAALDAVLALNGAELVPDGEKGLKLLINGKPSPRRAPSAANEKP